MSDQDQTRAVSTRAPGGVVEAPSSGEFRSIAVLGEAGVERFVKSVTIPVNMQYKIAGEAGDKVSLTSDGYLHLNRVMGVQIVQPEWVHDERGERVRNPIHRKDYIYLRVGGIHRNDLGQLTSYYEDIEVDYQISYHEARAKSKSARVQFAESPPGNRLWNDDGTPMIRIIVNDDDELKAWRRLIQLRAKGILYAQTVGVTRVLKYFSGVKSLPIRQPQTWAVQVVGYVDGMTPGERIAEAQKVAGALWGASVRLGEADVLRDDEMAELAEDLGDAEEVLEGEAQAVETAQAEPEEAQVQWVEPTRGRAKAQAEPAAETPTVVWASSASSMPRGEVGQDGNEEPPFAGGVPTVPAAARNVSPESIPGVQRGVAGVVAPAPKAEAPGSAADPFEAELDEALAKPAEAGRRR